MIAEEDRETVTQLVQSMSIENPTVTIENRVIIDGEIRWTQWINRMLFDEQGQFVELQSVGRDITKLKQTQETLRISEERLKLALEGSGNGLWDWNVVTGEVYLSANWLTMLGYAEQELPLAISTWEQLLHPDDKPWVMDRLNAHFKDTSVPYTFDYRLLTKSGAWKWVANYGRVVARDENGAALRMVGTHQDISDRKKTEEQLRTLSERLTLALQSGGFGIWEYDFVQNKLIWDDRLYELYGVTPDNGVNTLDTWLGYVHPDDREQVLEAIQQLLQEDKEYYVEFRIVQPSGEIYFLKSYGILQRDDQGNPVRMVGVNGDITKRKLADVALQESERRYATLTEAAPVGIFRFDTSGNCIYVNDRWGEMTGRPPSAALGMGWSEAVHPQDRERLLQEQAKQFGRGIEPGEAYQCEGRHLRPDGSINWFVSQIIPETDANGILLGYIGTLTNISALKLAEQELIRNRDLREAIFNESADALFLVDPDTQLILDCNQRAVELFEVVDKTELIGIEGSTLHRQTLSGEERAVSAAKFRSQGFWSRELEYITRKGNSFWGNIAAKTISVAERTLTLVRITDISDRKQAQEALAKYAREVEDLYNNAPCGYHSLDPEGRLMNVNETELQWLGYTREEMIGKPFTNFVTPVGQSVFEQNYPCFKERGWVKDLEYEMVCKDGTIIPVLLNATAVKDADGTYLYNRATLFDIRDRKQAEQVVQELNTAMQNAVEGIARLDIDGRYISVNRAYANLCGYEPDEMIGQSWQQTVYADDLPDLIATYQKMLQIGKVEAEARAIHRDGSIVYKQVTMITARDQQGNFAGNHCFMKDISDRKRAEDIIKKQAQRELLLRVITQRVRQTLDLDEILTTAADEVRQTFQTERALILRLFPDGTGQVIKEAVLPSYPSVGEKSWIDRCLHPDDIKRHYIIGQPRIVPDITSDELGQCLGNFLYRMGVRSKISSPIIQTLDNGSTQIWGFLIIHACDNYRQWLPEEAGLLQQISNQLAIAIQQADLYQRVQTELTERKLAEEQLRQTNEQLANANIELARATRLKDEFLANMSHELRTPLNAILGMSEGLQDDVFGSINDRQLKAIATIERSGRHLLELINDILDLSKIESGKLELQISDVPVRSLCDASLGFIRQMAQNKNIHLSTRIPNNVGNIQADDRRLRQLLINLLSNAVKFTPEGGSVTLEVRLEQAGEANSPSSCPYLCFCVIDTGIGIAPEDIGKLFQAFVQIDSRLNRQYSGTGLGLALVKRIATLHGGTVSVESELGRGSCFTVRIPHHSTCEVSQMQGTTPLPKLPFPMNQAPVLIIEDSSSVAEKIARYLKEYGMQGIIYPHGEGALEEVLRVQPSLVILDVLLPNQSGWNVLTQLKAHPQTQNIPVLMISGLDERTRGLAMGASDYLVKPITRAELQATLTNLQGTLVTQSSPLMAGQKSALKPPLILLVEDNLANLDTISGYIESRGYGLIVATNGQQAISFAKTQHPDLIVMDIQMPGMDGLEAIRHIRAEGQNHIPIIALTALAMPADRTKCLDAGANEYLSKPIKLKQLVATIQQTLAQTKRNVS